MVGKFGTNMDVGEGRHPWEDHTYHGDVHVHPSVGGPCRTVMGIWKKGWYHFRWRAGVSCSISPKYVTVGTCQGFC